MIPKIVVFQGSSIESAITNYEIEFPEILEKFEKDHGECHVYPGIVCDKNNNFIITVVLIKSIAKSLLGESNDMMQSGKNLIDQLSNRLFQIFNAEGCDHDWVENELTIGPKIFCAKCKMPFL